MARQQARSNPDASSQAVPSSAPIRVEVRSRFNGEWCHGFTVDEVDVRDDGTEWFKVRRSSDGWLLPDWFVSDDVIAERHPARSARPENDQLPG